MCINFSEFRYTTFSPHVLSLDFSVFMYWTCNSMNNLSSYCGLVDAKIGASDKDLPVRNGLETKPKLLIEKYSSYSADCFATSCKSALWLWLFWKNFVRIGKIIRRITWLFFTLALSSFVVLKNWLLANKISILIFTFECLQKSSFVTATNSHCLHLKTLTLPCELTLGTRIP